MLILLYYSALSRLSASSSTISTLLISESGIALRSSSAVIISTIPSPILCKSTVSVLYDDGTVQTFNTGVNTKNEKIPRNEEIKNTIDQSLQDSNLIGTDKKVAWETYRDMLITWVNNNGTESEFYINYPITTWLDEGNKTEFSTWLSGNQKSSIKSGEDAPLFPEEDND